MDSTIRATGNSTVGQNWKGVEEKIKTGKTKIDSAKEVFTTYGKEPSKIGSSILKMVSWAKFSDLDEKSPLVSVSKRVSVAISALGLVSFVNMLFNFIGIPFSVKSMVDKARIGDVEGIILSGTDTVFGAVETVSDMGSGVSALAALGAIPVVAAFAIIALPFAIAGLGYAVGKGVYNVAHHAKFLHDMRKLSQEATANKVDRLKAYIDDKLGVEKSDDGKIKLDEQGKLKCNVLKVSILDRRADKKTVELMKKFRESLETEQDAEKNQKTADQVLGHIKGYMWRKIAISSVGIIGNAALLGGLIATLATPVAPLAIPIIAIIKSLLGIAKTGLNFGLEKWDKHWYSENGEGKQFAPIKA